MAIVERACTRFSWEGLLSSKYASKPMATRLNQSWDITTAPVYASTIVVLASTEDPKTEEPSTDEPRTDEPNTETPRIVESPYNGVVVVRALIAVRNAKSINRIVRFRSKLAPRVFPQLEYRVFRYKYYLEFGI